jgi:hypothetical protein
VLQGAAFWLTPRVVEKYEPGDFGTVPQQDELRRAVERFRSVASAVSPKDAPTQEQFTRGVEAFNRLTDAVRGMVLSEWQGAVEHLIAEAEAWVAERQWVSRRVKKTIEESLLGTYELPQLQFYADQNLYILDPIGRFVPGALGSIDLAIQPSYYVSTLYRYFDGRWYVHLDVGERVREGRGLPWERATLVKAVEELRSLL